MFIIFCAFLLLIEYVDISVLLVLPVLLVSWYGSNKAGLSLAVLSAILISVVRFIEPSLEGSIYDFYNIIVTLIAYSVVALIVTNFRKVHRVEVIAADTDTLTGVHSSRSFYANIANEILRSNRYGHIFSLAYIDVDNFKKINDSLGHDTGDKLLIEVSRCLVSSCRATDTVARMGGDEFVCLFPETEQNESKAAVLKAEKSLKEIMNKNGWDVSFSIGVVSFKTVPEDVHEALKIADELMYSVKNGNKNGIAYEVWHGGA
jgi:diguanylate cyclase (GGDEF)-like protein